MKTWMIFLINRCHQLLLFYLSSKLRAYILQFSFRIKFIPMLMYEESMCNAKQTLKPKNYFLKLYITFRCSLSYYRKNQISHSSIWLILLFWKWTYSKIKEAFLFYFSIHFIALIMVLNFIRFLADNFKFNS